MKAVVLGGAGVVGSCAVSCLAEMDDFTSVTIADRDEKRASMLTKKYEHVNFVPLDATDTKSIEKSLSDADVAINCVGPFYKFAPKILDVAIGKGVNYVDICDDYDTTEELLDRFHKKAVDAGVTAIIGLGASPGLTNIIAKFASQQLTSVESIQVYVTRGIQEESGGAIPYHMLHCWVGDIPIFTNGKFSKAKGLVDGEEYVKFPEPFGQTPVYYFGHPETVTLPRYIKGVKHVCCKGMFYPYEFRDALVQLESFGFLSEKPIDVQGMKIKPIDFTAQYVEIIRHNISSKAQNIPQGGAVMVEVTGEEDGQPRVIRYAGTSHMREGTGTPAAIGAKMIVKGEIKSPGVQAPEACVPPELFIAYLLEGEGFGDVWVTFTQNMTGI